MNVGIWVRVSTDDQARGESPETHMERGKYYCLAKGWTIAETYDLSGVSGKTVLEHHEAQRMLSDIKTGKIQGLVFSKLARLARNTKDLLEISEIFQQHNASLVSIEESIDTSSPAGRLLYTVIGALAQWEREEISARVSASVPIRAKMGKSTGGIGPYGYQWVDKQLVPHPAEAAVVRRAFELFQEIGKVLTTCEKLNAEGLRPRKTKWNPTTLKRLLTNPVYIGKRIANYSSSQGAGKSWKRKPEKDWVTVDVEAILDTATWDAVQRIFNTRTAKYPTSGPPKEGKHLYSGLLFCECGEKMYVQPYDGMRDPRYVCKVCKNKINESVVTQHLKEGLERIVVDPPRCTDYDAKILEREQRLQVLRREVPTLKAKIEQAWDLKFSREIDEQGFRDRYHPLRERKDQIESEIPRLEAEISAARVSALNKDFVFQEAKKLSQLWDVFTDDERARIAKELVKKVRIGADTLQFSLFYLPEFSELENGDRTGRDSAR